MAQPEKTGRKINPEWIAGTPEFEQRHKTGGYFIWQNEKKGIPQGKEGQDANYFASINRDIDADREVESTIKQEEEAAKLQIRTALLSVLKGPSVVTVNDFINNKARTGETKNTVSKKDSKLENPDNILLDEIVKLGDKVKQLDKSGKDDLVNVPVKEGKLINPTHEEIEKAAYFDWLNNGKTHGHDVSDWLAAEKRLREQLNANALEELDKEKSKEKARQSTPTTTPTVQEGPKQESPVAEKEIAPKPKTLAELRQELEVVMRKAQEIASLIAKMEQVEAEKQKPADKGAEKAEDKSKQQESEIKIGPATWNGLSIEITGLAGQIDGELFVRIKGSRALIPLNEVEYPKKQSEKAEEKAKQMEIKTGPATWKTKNNDIPVNITGYAGKGPDGKDYVYIEGSKAAIPLDEVQYPKEKAGKVKEGSAEETEADKTKEKTGKEEVVDPKKAAEDKAAAAEKERQRQLEEQRRRLEVIEAARKEGEAKGKEDLWKVIKRPRGIKERLKILFSRHRDPKTDEEKVAQYKKEGYINLILAGLIGTLATIEGVVVAQTLFGHFLVPWVNKVPEVVGNKVIFK